MPPSRIIQAEGGGPPHPYQAQPRRRDSGFWTFFDTPRRSFKKIKNSLSTFTTDERQDKDEKRALVPIPKQRLLGPNQESTETETRPGRADHDDPSSQIFQSRVDHCSESEIVADCEALNNKIRDAVLTVIDEWVKTSSREGGITAVKSRTGEHKVLRRCILGDALYMMIKQLGESRSSFGDLEDKVTDALQASAVYIVNWIISDAFCPAIPDRCDAVFQTVFKHMVSHESQPAALRWRAMAYVHAVRSMPTGPTSGIEAFVSTLQYELTCLFHAIFVLAGEDTSSSFLSCMSHLASKCGVIESAMQLAEKLKMSIFSAYLDTYWVNAKLVFDEQTMDKDGSIGTSECVQACLVVCTLELGIREIVTGTHDAHCTHGRTGRVLLKPKVLVEGV